MNPIAVFTTVDSRAVAREIARAMVERRLAACAQISEIESFYFWDEQLQQESEYRVLFKTAAECYDALEKAILRMHPYELPAIHAFACSEVYPPYRDWIRTAAQVEKT